MTNSGLTDLQKRNHMKQLAEYRKKLWEEPQLHSLFLEVTGLCNEHCRHCGSSCGDYPVRDQLTLEEIKELLDQVKEDFDISKLRLCVTGGEPLLRPDFFEIMEYAHTLGYHWGMTSNGILIDKSVAHKLYETGMETISVSIDGLRETHDWFRQKTGSYDAAVKGIECLLEEGGFKHVQVTTVVHHHNIDELEDMYCEIKKMGVRSWRVINIEPIGRALTEPGLALNRDEYRKMFDFIDYKRFANPNFTVTYGCSHYLGSVMEREVRKWYFLCNAGIYTASVMYNGNIGACLDLERREETIQGNIRKDRFSKVWRDRFEIFRSDYRKKGHCADCKDYEFCVGDSFHTWDFDKNEPKICMKKIIE